MRHIFSMAASMASPDFLIPFLFTITLLISISSTSLMYPYACLETLRTCNSSLYHIQKGLQVDQIASLYSVNKSQIKPISRNAKEDLLVSVPCACKNVTGTVGYFYDTSYKVELGDTFVKVSDTYYSGQAWEVEGEEALFIAGNRVPMNLLCGCVETNTQVVVTYTVQENDTIAGIAQLLSAEIQGIERLNKALLQNTSFIEVGWVLFVPMEINGTQIPKKGSI